MFYTKAAIVRNIKNGDGINIAIMDKDGFRLLTEEQKKAVIELSDLMQRKQQQKNYLLAARI